MAPTSIVFSMIVFLLLSNAITTQAGTSGSGKPKATSLIVEACKNASGKSQDTGVTKEFCLSTLQLDSRSAKAKDLRDLVVISIDILKGRVSDAGVKVKKMLQNAKKGTLTMHALSICELQYEKVVSTLNICQAMIRDHQGDKGDLKSLGLLHCVDMTGETIKECENELGDVRGAEALLSENEGLRILANLNRALVAPYDV
uniref:Pectinesterase inhibitor domain-containing protein n=2 Tax=Aegilops tauschii TaxID=37682 RepID=N1R2Y5_AEGTA